MQRLYDIFYFLIPFIFALLFAFLVGHVEGSETISRPLLTIIGAIVAVLIIVSMVIYYFLLRERISQVVPDTGEVTQKEILESIDQSNIGYAIMDQQGRMLFCSDSARVLLAPDPHTDIIGQLWYEIDDESPAIKAERRKTWEVFIRNRGEWQGFIRWRRSSGEMLYFDTTVCYLDSGRVTLVVNDRTDRVTAARELAAREKLHQYILDNIPMSITIQDVPTQRVLYTNEYLPARMGMNAETLTGLRPADFEGVVPIKPLTDLLDQVITTGVAVESYQMAVPSGVMKGTHWLLYIYPVLDKEDKVQQLLAVSIDITDQVELTREKELFARKLSETQKVEALNKFAGGLAHELSNLLHPVGVYARTLGENPDHEKRTRYLSRINRAVLKAGTILRQTLSMSRTDAEGATAQNLNTILADHIDYARDIAPAGISYALTLPDKPVHGLVDDTELRQVMMNLLVNAIDAQSGEGTIRIRLGADHSLPEDPTMAITSLGPFAWIDVTDTGDGMDESTRRKIFEPFFTTKEKGKGTGLGLAVVQGMVTGWGGIVSVDTAPGKGSTFRVWIPLAPADLQDIPAAEPAEARTVRSEEHA